MTEIQLHEVDPARGHDVADELVLSVVIPTHNVEPWIDELLASVLTTSFPEMEVIVVDDHSTDGTLQRVRELAAADPRVHLLIAHERGGARARNVGLAAARGRYVAFADGDDIIPPGSYERLVWSLERSGSDIAFGDWLKFSSTKTWQPSRNWRVFDEDRIGVALASVPALIRGRAVWNKVFRRSFLTEAQIVFPEVPRSNDIVPMTRAYLSAGTIDVLADCVYLYRDRPGTGSMTSRAGAGTAAVSYFNQEAACAALIAARGDEALMRTYSALVFDADSWLHLSRVLRELDQRQLEESGVAAAVAELVSRAPRSGLARATPHKQVLWGLVAAGEIEVAIRFNRLEESARSTGHYDGETLDGWLDAVTMLITRSEVLPEIDRRRLVVEGLATVLLHHARDLSREESDALTRRAHNAAVTAPVDVESVRPWTLALIVRALRDGVDGLVRLVSSSRDVRLVADHAALLGTEVLLAGDVPATGIDGTLTVVLRRVTQEAGVADVRASAQVQDGRWSVRVAARTVRAGRWELSGAFTLHGATVEVPVVTARMSLPVAERADRFRVLADRQRSWRVLLERRPATVERAVRRFVRR